MPSSLPSTLRPSSNTIPKIFSTIRSYTSAVEWFYYLTFISHIICKSESAHIVKANLVSFLRARRHIQMWHEALLCEIYEADEPNLPSVLDVVNYANPSVKRFQEYIQQRFKLMTNSDCLIARCVVVDYIYRKPDEAEADARKSKDDEHQKEAEQLRRAIEERDQARERYVSSCLQFGKFTHELPSPTGQIGVVDLAKLMQRLCIEPYAESTAMLHPLVVDFDLSTGNERACSNFLVGKLPDAQHSAANEPSALSIELMSIS